MMVQIMGMLSLLLFISSYSMQQQKDGAAWATKELQERTANAYFITELLYLPEAKQKFCAVHEKDLLPMVEHLIKMGANPHVWNWICVNAIKQDYIKSKTALEFARELKLHEVTSLLEAIPEHKEKIR